jgi:hypothetical protein
MQNVLKRMGFVRLVDVTVMALAITIGTLVVWPRSESQSLLIHTDDGDYFECMPRGCWNRVRTDVSWQALAAYTKADQTRLREGNPQIHGDVVHAGDQILIGDSMKADR